MSEHAETAPESEGAPVILVWPSPDHGRVTMRGVTVCDAETRALLPAVVRIHLDLGGQDGPGPGPVVAELTEFCDATGAPLRNTPWEPVMSPEYDAHREALRALVGDRPMTETVIAEIDVFDAAFTGPRFRTVTTRYPVAHMRVARPAPKPRKPARH